MSDPRILLVDAGNTRIKWAVREAKGWAEAGAIPTADSASLATAWRSNAPGTAIACSNVAGDRVKADLETAASGIGASLRIIQSRAEQLGVRNGYARPEQLGSDRWAALIAAHAAHPSNQLVVNAGTALTVDALTATGEFRGGIIVPGPALMRHSLDRNTAGLRLAEGAVVDFPKATADAITSGAIQAAVGAIERMATALERALGEPRPRIVISGGGAAEIVPYLPRGATVHDNLVLEGLFLIARDS